MKKERKQHLSGNTLWKRLSRHLVLLYTISTGLILAISLILAWLYSQNQAEAYARETFWQLFSTIEERVQHSNRISQTWLRQTEQEYQCGIYIEDNGYPLLYQSTCLFSDSLPDMIETIKQKALKQGIQSDCYPLTLRRKTTDILTLSLSRFPGASYLAAMSQVASGENWQNIFLIQEKSPTWQDSLLSASYFLFLFAFGQTILSVFGRFLIRQTLHPVQESMQKQKEFVAAASHELRTPLAVLQMNLSALFSDFDSSCLDDMQEEIHRMTGLIDDMLTLASLDAKGESGWQIALSPLEPEAFLIDLYEDFRPVVSRSGLTLSLHLPENPLSSIQADRKRLWQIFSILIDNACSYAAEGKTLELSADGDATLSLIDHGPGIPAEKRAHIFERFVRGEDARTHQMAKHHYGLGLSIAAELASLHHASLMCTETPGGGCTFTLRLPK